MPHVCVNFFFIIIILSCLFCSIVLFLFFFFPYWIRGLLTGERNKSGLFFSFFFRASFKKERLRLRVRLSWKTTGGHRWLSATHSCIHPHDGDDSIVAATRRINRLMPQGCSVFDNAITRIGAVYSRRKEKDHSKEETVLLTMMMMSGHVSAFIHQRPNWL